MYSLVLLETSGNQAYVFATNKLRENMGASELTRRAGTMWVLGAVESLTHQHLYQEDPERLQDALNNHELNPRIEDGARVEVVEAVSGKAVLLVRDEQDAKRIVSLVTLKALREAPGLDIKGVVVPVEWSKEGGVAEALRMAYRRYEETRTSRPGPESRFLRLPVVAECATSGMPASEVQKDEAISMQTMSKRDAAEAIQKRTTDVDAPAGWRFAYKLSDDGWLAIVHADGNGLGKVFLHFEDFCREDRTPPTNREYVDTLRSFSCAVDVCTHGAFKSAVAEVAALVHQSSGKTAELPLRPLVLGGDDLTVMCDAGIAFPFVEKYLEQFEAKTASNEVITPIARRMTNDKIHDAWLSACAGVAVVKSHYPFFAAYSLAEELVTSAKDSKKKLMQEQDEEHAWSWPCSALDFHVLHDSSSMELKDIRDKLTLDKGKTLLYGAPYVVTPQEKLEGAGEKPEAWAALHSWEQLKKRVEVLRKKDREGKRVLPNSQIHELRGALFGGKDTADHAVQLIAHRYGQEEVTSLVAKENSLFAEETKPDGGELHVTQLLDAMEAGEFLPVTQAEKRDDRREGDEQ